MDEHYFCKHKDCNVITLAMDWVDNNGGQYACPMCSRKYKPWVTQEGSEGLTKANKVMVVKRDDKSIKVFPFWWPDTATQILVNEFKRIAMDIDHKLEEIPPTKRMDYVMNLVSQIKAPPAYMQKMQMTQYAINESEEKNEQHRIRKGNRLWNYEKVAKNGFMAMKFADFNEDDVLQQEDVIRMWA